MTKQQLLFELDRMTAHRVNRLHVSSLILQDKKNLKLLLNIVFDIDNKISIKAAWALEFVCKEKLEWLFIHLDYFTNNLQKAHYGSVVRPLAKICELLLLQHSKTPFLFLKLTHKERIAETVFDWLISDHKVAIKAYAMTVLFFLGKEMDWIHEALKIVIIKGMTKESSAYKARGRITLQKMEKYQINTI